MENKKFSSKTGGRKKGTPNKKSQQINEALALVDFDLVDEFTKLYSAVDNDRKVVMIVKLMEFCFPKKKAIDITSDQLGELQVAADKEPDLSKLTLEELQQLHNIQSKLSA